MLTTTHAIWTYILFRKFSRLRHETPVVVLASIVPDIEILFWTGMSFMDSLFKLNPFNIDYNDLLHGSGVSFHYWPITLATNSVLSTSAIIFAFGLILRRNRRTLIMSGLAIQFHIFLDAFTHKTGNMLFWPLSINKYLGMFEFNELPLRIKVAEQILSFGLLAIVLVFCKQRSRIIG